MSSTTTNYAFTLPAVNSATDEDLWGTELNSNWSSIDSLLAAKLSSASPVWTGTASGVGISLTGTAYLTAGIAGTTTNDAASVGIVGQIVESTVLVGAAVPLSSATVSNVTSVPLTAGDWDVWGNIIFNPAVGTTIANTVAALNTVSATLPTPPAGGAYDLCTSPGTGVTGLVQSRFSVSALTTVYLVCYSSFSGGIQSAYGYIGARRVR